MQKLAAIITVLMVLAGTAAAQNAEPVLPPPQPQQSLTPFCMSDEEVRAYLAEYSIYELARRGGYCYQNYPALSEDIRKNILFMSRPLKSYGVRPKALQAYQRSFGAEAENRMQTDFRNERTFKPQFTVSERECQSLVSIYKGIAVSTRASYLKTFIHQKFPEKRKAVPTCS
jgi:hypothetical protein